MTPQKKEKKKKIDVKPGVSVTSADFPPEAVPSTSTGGFTHSTPKHKKKPIATKAKVKGEKKPKPKPNTYYEDSDSNESFKSDKSIESLSALRTEITQEQEEAVDEPLDIQPRRWVVVKYTKKATTKHFVGEVLTVDNTENICAVRFANSQTCRVCFTGPTSLTKI